jgi:hypothetical protein
LYRTDPQVEVQIRILLKDKKLIPFYLQVCANTLNHYHGEKN